MRVFISDVHVGSNYAIFVAFEEIPQRELRASSTNNFRNIKTFCKVAFEEIPQRELRAIV